MIDLTYPFPCYAFNPIVVTADYSEETTYVGDIATLDILDRYNNFICRFKRYKKNNIATFEISGAIKPMLPRAGIIPNKTRFIDEGLSVIFKVRDENGTKFTSMAINGVKRIGEANNGGQEFLKILSSLSSWTTYAGYPFAIYVLVGNNLSGFESGKCVWGIKDVETYLNENSETVYLLNEAGDYLLYPDNDYIVLKKGSELPVNIGCTPNNPFYVKWVNKKGGVDFWMFQINQEYKLNLTGVEKQRVFFNDNNTATGSHKVYKKSADYQITAGADNLTAEQYNALSMIPFSPDIQWYCEDLGKWVDLAIDKSETVHETNTPRKEIELTFTLPELQLQQL